MTTDFDRLDRAVVNAFQGGFPVVRRPFDPVANALRERGIDATATDVRECVERLDELGVLSRFGALFDANAIGGTTTLVALDVPDERFDAVAERINAYREVAHNYERDHRLNMWFVLSVADAARVNALLDRIERETGLETYPFPKQREFYLRARFPIDGPFRDEGIDLSDVGPDPNLLTNDRESLTPRERDLIVAIQDGLPITNTPYADVASDLGVSVDWTCERLARFRADGTIRRIGIVPNHYALGYTENGMTVWNIPDDAVGDVGEAIGALPFVTHCYERPRHPDVWPHNLFAMVHGRTAEECQTRIDRVRETVCERIALDDDDWTVLFSTRLLKKTGLRLAERANAHTA